ncbi:MAG: hypothetical protein V5A31_08475 [Haloferacaceae archaeon]|jgi:hypothetical protein
MTRERLQTAADRLRAASDAATDDAADRLTDLAERLDSHATADRGPDHGTMARVQHQLTELRAGVDDDHAAALIDDAKDAISDYRSTVDGV